MENGNGLRRDGAAKRVLSNARCLAHVLKRSVKKLEGMSADEIADLMSTTEDGLDVVPLSPEVRVGGTAMAFDLLVELRMPDGSAIMVDVEIQGRATPAIGLRQSAYLGGLRVRSFPPVLGDYGSLCRVYCIWIILNPPAALRNRVVVRELTGGGWDVPMTVVEFHLGSPDGVGDPALRLLCELFDADSQPEECLARVGAEFNIRWRDDTMEEIVMTMSELLQQCRQGAKEAREEDALNEGIRRGYDSGRAKGQVEGCAEMVSRLLDAGHSMEDALALVPESIAEDVRRALSEKRR